MCACFSYNRCRCQREVGLTCVRQTEMCARACVCVNVSVRFALPKFSLLWRLEVGLYVSSSQMLRNREDKSGACVSIRAYVHVSWGLYIAHEVECPPFRPPLPSSPCALCCCVRSGCYRKWMLVMTERARVQPASCGSTTSVTRGLASLSGTGM